MVQLEAHVDTVWDFSNTVVPEKVPLDAGEHICWIEKATENKEWNTVTLGLRDVENGQYSDFTYYMLTKAHEINEMTIRIMNGLKGALRGNNKGCLAPQDILHGVVAVKVEKEIYQGKERLSVKSYNPVSRATLDIIGESYDVQKWQYVLED